MHNGKSLMQSEITFEQFCFTFFASSELSSCLSRSGAEAKISQGKSLIVKVLKTWDPREPRLLSSKEEGPERGEGGAGSGRGAGGAAGKPRQSHLPWRALRCAAGTAAPSNSSRQEGQCLSDRIKLEGRSNFLPTLQSKQKCQYRQHNGAIETGE